MEILGFILALAFLISLVAGYAWSVGALNRYSEEQYRYTPITFGKSAIVTLPLALICLGVFGWQEIEQIDAGVTVLVAFSSASLILVALFWRIASKSSVGVAASALVVLVINATLILAAIGVSLFLALLRSESRRRY